MLSFMTCIDSECRGLFTVSGKLRIISDGHNGGINRSSVGIIHREVRRCERVGVALVVAQHTT